MIYFNQMKKVLENTIVVSREQLIDLVNLMPQDVYERLPYHLKLDSEIIDLVFYQRGSIVDLLKFAPNELKTDREFLLNILNQDEKAIGFVDETLLKDEAFIKQIIFNIPKILPYVLDIFKQVYPNSLEDIEEIKRNHISAVKKQDFEVAAKLREVVNAIKTFEEETIHPKKINKIISEINVEKNEIKYLHEFKFDRNLFLQQETNFDLLNESVNVECVYKTLIYLPELYKNDKEVLIKLINYPLFAIKNDKTVEYILSNLNDQMKSDKDVALALVSNSPKFVIQLSDCLKNDFDIALSIAKKDGLMLKYLSKDIRKNETIVLEAIRNNSYALLYASDELKKTKLLIIEALTLKPDLILHIDQKWTLDPEIKSIVIERKPILSSVF